jgi:hypothetical protein
LTDTILELIRRSEKREDDNEFTLFAKAVRCQAADRFKEAHTYYTAIDQNTLGIAGGGFYRSRWCQRMAKRPQSGASRLHTGLGYQTPMLIALNNRGVIYLKLDNDKAALADLTAVTAIKGDNPEYFSNRGITFSHMYNWRASVEDFDGLRSVFQSRGLLP